MGATRAKIAVDAMGGDRAPGEIVAGAIRATEELDVDILLVGDPTQIESHLGERSPGRHLEIVPAREWIGMEEEPVASVKRKRQASINVAMNLVKEKRARAVVSAGHSGATMAAALLRLGRIKGVHRPAIAALFPTAIAGKSVMILDVGANTDCRPKYLEQFALMGKVYSQSVLGVEDPKIGLLNIGEEASKGDELALRSYELLQANAEIPFAGNAEGRDILSGQFDVVVCDGFAGNVLLKFAEGVGDIVFQILKEELPQGWRGQLGSLLLEPNLRRLKQRIDHGERGGGLLLGVAGVCIISHGSSQGPTIFSAIRLAQEAIQNQALERLEAYYTSNEGESALEVKASES